jgi:hypothetical protein
MLDVIERLLITRTKPAVQTHAKGRSTQDAEGCFLLVWEAWRMENGKLEVEGRRSGQTVPRSAERGKLVAR